MLFHVMLQRTFDLVQFIRNVLGLLMIHQIITAFLLLLFIFLQLLNFYKQPSLFLFVTVYFIFELEDVKFQVLVLIDELLHVRWQALSLF